MRIVYVLLAMYTTYYNQMMCGCWLLVGFLPLPPQALLLPLRAQLLPLRAHGPSCPCLWTGLFLAEMMSPSLFYWYRHALSGHLPWLTMSQFCFCFDRESGSFQSWLHKNGKTLQLLLQQIHVRVVSAMC